MVISSTGWPGWTVAASSEIDYRELPGGIKIFLSSKTFGRFGKVKLENSAIESRCPVNKIC
jgi:hypothetical protein